MLTALAVAVFASAAQGKPPPPAKAPPAAKPAPQKAAPRRLEITVTEHGFEPRHVKVSKDEELMLVFTRKTERTCAKEVVIQTDGEQKIRKQLPLDTPVEIAVKFGKTGEFSYACGMGMYASVISVQ